MGEASVQVAACIASSSRFDGSGDYVDVPYSSELNLRNTDFTVEAWVYLPIDGVDPGGRFIEMVTSQGFSAWNMSYNGNAHAMPGLFALAAGGGGGPSTAIVSTMPIPFEEWAHIAAVFHAGTLEVSLWINGEPAGTGTFGGAIAEASGSLVIGADAWTHANYFFLGLLDQIRIASRARYSASFVPFTTLGRDEDTIALWHFDEGTGTVVSDRSGNGHDGVITNATWSAVSACGPASCMSSSLSFDGSGDYVDVPYSADLNLMNTDFTIEAWVNLPSTGGDLGWRIIEMVTSTGISAWNLRCNGSGHAMPGLLVLGAGGGGGPSTAIVSAIPIPFDEWTHVAAVFDAGTLAVSLWINGEDAGGGTFDDPIAQGAGPLAIGADAWTRANYFLSGSIDQLRITSAATYSTPFTAATLFAAGQDTVALWHFDEGGGTVASDSSENNHDGAIIGAGWSLQSVCTP